MIFLIFETFREWVMKLVGGRSRKIVSVPNLSQISFGRLSVSVR
jgi:hypothetical protein